VAMARPIPRAAPVTTAVSGMLLLAMD